MSQLDSKPTAEMITDSKTRLVSQARPDSEWVAALSGALGIPQQEEAINDLTRYLYVVVHNNLMSRRRNLPLLSNLHHDELADLTLDFLQQFMEKLVRSDYALLSKYHATGRFTAWASQVMLNIISSELRRAQWSRQEHLHDHGDHTSAAQPEKVVLNRQLGEQLQVSIHSLPDRMRNVFIRRFIHGESTATIAKEMGVSTNTIHLLVHRGRKQLRALLAEAGVGLDELRV